MAAQKPRLGDGPLEVVKEGRQLVVRIPLEGGGRIALSVSDEEVRELYSALEPHLKD